MSVFTLITRHQLQALLDAERLTLSRFVPASEGIENSNYFVSAIDADYQPRELVLTILENVTTEAAQWYHALLMALGSKSLPVPVPLGGLQDFDGKPVMLAPRLNGKHPEKPGQKQAYAIGRLLAQLHNSGFDLPSPAPNERQQLARLASFCPLLPKQWQAPAQLLLNDWQATQGKTCLIHGDLFRDNTLFIGNQLTGVLDFYHACHDLPIYDMAVALNDWALTEQAACLPGVTDAILDGYVSLAPLPTPDLLPKALAVAALRFWLSRLAASQSSKHSLLGRGSKPPDEFAKKFQLRWQQLAHNTI